MSIATRPASPARGNRHHPAHLEARALSGFEEAHRCVKHAKRWKSQGRAAREISDMVRHAFRVHREALELHRRALARRLPELPSRQDVEGAGYHVFLGQRFTLTQAGREALAQANGTDLCHWCDREISWAERITLSDGTHLHRDCAAELAELDRVPDLGVENAFSALPERAS